MKNEKILDNLANQLEDLKRQVLRMNRNDYELHRLDIEILQKIIRELYEQVIELENSFEEDKVFEQVSAKPEITKPVVPPAASQANVPVEKPKAIEEIIQQKVETKEPEKTLEMQVHAEQVTEFELKNEIAEKDPEKEIVLGKPGAAVPAEEKKQDVGKSFPSSIDLFSVGSEPTIFDKISYEKEPSIADKMRQSGIADLRQGIGINEKFLFINELFNGDMGKYNKALDELNEMKTKEGVATYFIELKIHNQWQDDNDAYIKFKELLERKIG